MAAATWRLLLPFVACGIASAAQVSEKDHSVAAVEKVIQMLIDMSAKAKQEKKDEEVAFAKFDTFCNAEQSSLKNQIAKAAEEIDVLGAEIEKFTSDVKTLGEEISQLTSDVDSYTAKQKEQTAQREKEHAEFLAEQQDYGESVSALERAIQVLQRQNYDRPAKAVLLQLSEGEALPAQAKAMVAALLGMMEAPGDDAASFLSKAVPEANAYEFQSGDIIGLLKKLTDEFREKKGQCEKEEMNAQHAHDMVMTDLTNSINTAQRQIADKTALKSSKASKAAADKEQLTSTLATKAEDEATLKALETECSQKKLSFQEKQALRADEIEAIEKAVEILSSESVSGSAQKHLALVATALLQIDGKNSGTSRVEGIRRRVREFLTGEAARLHSPGLGLLVEKLSAGPFAKVKKLIDDMITRLLEEANADAEKEGWCDKEMGQSTVTRNRLTEEIDGLSAAVEEGKANILALADEIAELEAGIASLDAAMSEATELRAAEKAKNAATVEDAEAAQKAVAAAVAVLKDFYAAAATATGFVQVTSSDPVNMGSEEWKALANPDFVTGGGTKTVDKGHKQGMQTFGAAYQGQQDEAGGVLALLETIQSDFSNVQADTEAAEASSQSSYEAFMVESKKNKATKTRKSEMDAADKAAAEAKLRQDIADMKSTQDELLAADRYHAKLVPQCIDQGMTWEERTKARESEIASLQEALRLLSSPDIETSAF